jgi:hypothetical protein
VNEYSEEEMFFFQKLMKNNAHLILEFSQDGGVLYAARA